MSFESLSTYFVHSNSIISTSNSCSTMKLFRFVRKFLKTIGLTDPIKVPWNKNQQRCSLNFRNLFILICLLHLCISTLAFFLFEAVTIGEQADSFYTILTELMCLLNLLVSIWKVPQMIDTIERFEHFIGKSKR